MSLFLPSFSGKFHVEKLPPDIFERLEERAASGWIVRGWKRRANYTAFRRTPEVLEVSAGDFLTAISLGLNEVTLRREDEQNISYEVSYWRWTSWCILLCGGISAVLLFCIYFVPEMAEELQHEPLSKMILLGNVCFWGLVWPWVLTSMHKSTARRTLERILREETQESNSVDNPQTVIKGIPGLARGAMHQAGIRFESEAKFMGVPLLSVAIGPDLERGEMRGYAKGIVAVGDIARGVIALGGVAVGVFTFGGVSIGLGAAFGGLAVGGVAVGGAALGFVAVGGLAIGILAVGGAALGVYVEGGGAVSFSELLRHIREQLQ